MTMCNARAVLEAGDIAVTVVTTTADFFETRQPLDRRFKVDKGVVVE